MYSRNASRFGTGDGRRGAAGTAEIHPRRRDRGNRALPDPIELTVSGARPRPGEDRMRKLTAADAPGALRRDILRALERYGPLTAAEIPRSWPVTRQHVRDVMREMADDGLVGVTSGDYGCRSFRLTDLGRRCLEELDWSAAIEADQRDAPGD